MSNFRIILVCGVAIGGVMVSLAIQHRARIKLQENDTSLLQRDYQLAELAAEYQRLSNMVAKPAPSTQADRMAELAKLRSEAETLRRQKDDLRKHLAENHPSQVSEMASVADDAWELHEKQRDQLASGKMKDAETLGWVLGKYAFEHHGEFPSSLDEVAQYLREIRQPLMPLTGTNDFEIVYHGSRNELTNIPDKTVALIRERHAWRAPSGKMARVYGMMDGTRQIVESADQFRAWEAEHVIPPHAKQ